jgi:hypothetical protein
MPVISIPFRTRQLTAEESVIVSMLRMMRENGFFRQLLPPVTISNDERDRPVPLRLSDESAPEAIAIPFAALPTETYIRGPRYRVPMYPLHDRMASPGQPAEVEQ